MGLSDFMDPLITHQSESGFFDAITRHEPKAKPGQNITAASFFNRLSPVPLSSGLAATTMRLEFITRMYLNMFAEPTDEIDPRMYDGASTLLSVYTAGFTLGGLIRTVDVLGANGEPLNVKAGYLNQAGTLYRTYDVITPLIINDLFPQAP